VLICGHCFCNECIAIIVEQYSVGSRRRAVQCAICRQTTAHAEISYVFTTQSSSQDQDVPVKVGPSGLIVQTWLSTGVVVLPLTLVTAPVRPLCSFINAVAHMSSSCVGQGSHSTKVEAVVRTLKKIQVADPGAKCLVFSTVTETIYLLSLSLSLSPPRWFYFDDTELGSDPGLSPPQWLSVLDIIAKALFDNNMEFSQINGIRKFQVVLHFLWDRHTARRWSFTASTETLSRHCRRLGKDDQDGKVKLKTKWIYFSVVEQKVRRQQHI